MLVGGGYIPASGGYIYNWPLGPIVYSPPLAQELGQQGPMGLVARVLGRTFAA